MQKNQNQITCYVCEKIEHFTKSCKVQKSKDNGELSNKDSPFQQANMIIGTFSRS